MAGRKSTLSQCYPETTEKKEFYEDSSGVQMIIWFFEVKKQTPLHQKEPCQEVWEALNWQLPCRLYQRQCHIVMFLVLFTKNSRAWDNLVQSNSTIPNCISFFYQNLSVMWLTILNYGSLYWSLIANLI